MFHLAILPWRARELTTVLFAILLLSTALAFAAGSRFTAGKLLARIAEVNPPSKASELAISTARPLEMSTARERAAKIEAAGRSKRRAAAELAKATPIARSRRGIGLIAALMLSAAEKSRR